jgi:hypothetical protein
MSEEPSETPRGTANSTEPGDGEPTPRRQEALRTAYEANTAIGRAPYAGVKIRTLGELQWILRERDWSGEAGVRGKRRPDLSGADMYGINLQGVHLYRANLSSADLARANLADADLRATNLRGARLWHTDLAGADLREVIMDEAARLRDIVLDEGSKLSDVAWNNAQLTRVDWPTRLGDEARIKRASKRRARVDAYRDAIRAYYGLAKALEAQGLTTAALRYRMRQHQLERAVQLREFKLGQWLFSSALNIISGYGDRPLRALGVYFAVILAFAGIYFGITTPGSPIFFSGSQPLQLHEAVVFSLSSFHGRGFFPSTIGLGDPVAIVAALEAVVGLFIELVLIATFTRRLFER